MKQLIKKILSLFFFITLLIFSSKLIKPSIQKQKIPLVSTESFKKKENNSLQKISNPKKDIYQWLRTVSEVVSIVEEKAFRHIDFSKFIQEALKSAVPHVDAHSAFFPKESYKSAIESTSGEFSGIGVSIISKAPEDDTLTIIEVIEGGPAHKAGLKSGDKIVEVNGEKLRGLSTDEVINKMKGKVKTEVKIKIIREKKPLEFKITRDIIKDQTSQCYFFKKQNIYYISLKIFAENSAKQVAELLKKANEGKCKGIIIDLRRNPGGILDSAVEMASLFLPKKSLIVKTKDRNKKAISSYHTKKDSVLKTDVPIFVLIDNFTASASEILAGCLKHYSEQNNIKKKNSKKLMVFLLGTPTFGKGSVQEVIPISNGCALKLTTMLYYLPNDNSIQAVGIKPDFLIKPKIIPSDEIKWINELYGKETSLKHYITVEEVEENNGKKESKNNNSKDNEKKNKNKTDKESDENEEKNWEEKHREAINQDPAIQTSINMISMLNLAKKCEPQKIDTRQKAVEFLKQNCLTDEQTNIEKVK
ncbi:PDZ domain-containing protein [Candidatus Dependentiae bacterium]|nr:PDZ domain-containing protein [Candidatus Dependentiae bacterium]